MSKTLSALSLLFASLVSIAAPSVSRAEAETTYVKTVTGVRSYPNGNVYIILGNDMPECSGRVMVRTSDGATTDGILSVALAAYLSGHKVRFAYSGTTIACTVNWLDIVD